MAVDGTRQSGFRVASDHARFSCVVAGNRPSERKPGGGDVAKKEHHRLHAREHKNSQSQEARGLRLRMLRNYPATERRAGAEIDAAGDVALSGDLNYFRGAIGEGRWACANLKGGTNYTRRRFWSWTRGNLLNASGQRNRRFASGCWRLSASHRPARQTKDSLCTTHCKR